MPLTVQLYVVRGDNLYRLAVIWWVIRQTGSATDMGLLLICTMVPSLLFLLIGETVLIRTEE